jgi:thymidylate synthase (FAD)
VISRLVVQSAGKGLPASQADFLAAQDPSWTGLERCRERDECLDKLVSLGLVNP